MDKNIFDYTSGAKDKLGLVKEILRIHAKQCDEKQLLGLENEIYKYFSPNAVNWYRRRIEHNRDKQRERVYWSFWGDLQHELLSCLPQDRLSKKTKELIYILDRKFDGISSIYYSDRTVRSGYVKSPISGKHIGKNQWLQIITNNKLRTKRYTKWTEEGIIESSCEMYANDFQAAVKKEPQPMIQFVLEHKDKVLPVFIDALFLGVEMSEHIEECNSDYIEELFRTFPCDLNTQRASYFCEIVEKRNSVAWSSMVINQLKEIALKHKNPELDKPCVTSPEDKQMKSHHMLHSNALNCVRGQAAQAIGSLLWEDISLFTQFKDVIEKLTLDENPAVRYATLFALWPSYNIDREWAEERIIRIYESDIRMAGFRDSKNMFFRLYSKYENRILKIIERCFNDKDEDIIKVGGYAVCEFYICYNEFDKLIKDVEFLSKEQIIAILDMAIIYLKIPDYRERAKTIILKYINRNLDLEFTLAQIFNKEYIRLDQDEKFLRELVGSKVGRRVVRSFIYYLEENAMSIVNYADIIIILCENILQMKEEELRSQWGIEDEISKLIISLYDETANSVEESNKHIAEKCLDLWDIMFERQLGSVRAISRKLAER